MLLHRKDVHHFQGFFIEINQNARTRNENRNTPYSDVPRMPGVQ